MTRSPLSARCRVGFALSGALLLAPLGCTHTTPYDEAIQLADDGDCERAQAAVIARGAQHQDQADELVSASEHVGAVASSYAVTAGGALTDFTLQLSGGVVVGVGACFPAMMLDGALRIREHGVSEACLKGVVKPTIDAVNPHLGEKAYDATAAWREDRDFTPLSRALRRSAGCFEQRGGLIDLVRGYVQLVAMMYGPLYDKVVAAERASLDEDAARMSKKIEALGSPGRTELERQLHALNAGSGKGR